MQTITIRKIKKEDAEVLALLGRVTYVESHGDFIENKLDLATYLKSAFSVTKLIEDIENENVLFHLILVDDLPVGYTKVVLNKAYKNEVNSCSLERIYILNDFIYLKLGQQLLNYIETEVLKLKFNTIWLSVYVKNIRAIKFYQKNNYINKGNIEFLVNEKVYDNIVFSKKLTL